MTRLHVVHAAYFEIWCLKMCCTRFEDVKV